LVGVRRKRREPRLLDCPKSDVGKACSEAKRYEKNPDRERKELRFAPDVGSGLNPKWKYARLEEGWRNNWALLKKYEPV
jgi:hypothetical protein